MEKEMEKEHTQYPSRYKIGESAELVIPLGNTEADKAEDKLIKIPVAIRAIIFTQGKIRYSVLLKGIKSTLHNVDSVFIRDSDDDEIVDFGMDNYS